MDLILYEPGSGQSIRVEDIRRPDNGEPMDMSAAQLRAQIRHYPGDPALLAEWVSGTPTAPQQQATGTVGQIELVTAPAVSRAWTWGEARLEVEATKDGVTHRFRAEIKLEHRLIDP